MVKRFLGAVALLMGCGGSSGSDLGEPPVADSGADATSDAGVSDAGTRLSDSGRDAGSVDSGTTLRDAGIVFDSGTAPATDSGSIDARPPCIPKTCASASRDCGSSSDGCGGTIQCGTCELPWICSSGYACTTAADGGRELSCDPSTCPMGCCDAFGRCQAGADNNECGTGGKACVDCQGTATPTCSLAARVCQ